MSKWPFGYARVVYERGTAGSGVGAGAGALGLAAALVPILALALSFLPQVLGAQNLQAEFETGLASPQEARAALARAQNASREAGERAQEFAAQAQAAQKAHEKTARENAALAAQIQQAEADIEATKARLALLASQRTELNKRLAKRQEPLVQLTAALQNMARRPLALSALQPGSLKDTVYVRAVLDSAVPLVKSRTAGLRVEIDKSRQLARSTTAQLDRLRASEQTLAKRRTALTAIARQQLSERRKASGIALRENERALALAEEARDLDGLIDTLDAAGALRRELAALPGPVMRPRDLTLPSAASPSPEPQDTGAIAEGAASSSPEGARALAFQLPVQGRIVTGFGETSAAGLPSNGIVIAPQPGAVIVAPASGRVAFAGPYRGFGQIVIIEHAQGFTSLVTGLARSDVTAGSQLLRGSPLGAAPQASSSITLELRRRGAVINPLDYL